jgi:hypothetical protein
VRRTLAGAAGYTISIDVKEIAVAADRLHASVTAIVNRAVRPRQGAPQVFAPVTNVFALQKLGDRWHIEHMR